MTQFLTVAKGEDQSDRARGGSRYKKKQKTKKQEMTAVWGFKLILIHCVWSLISGATRSLDTVCDFLLNYMI